MYYFGKDVEQSWSIVRLDFRRLLVLNNAYALLADIVVHRQLVKSAITDSIKMNQAKVHARFVMLDSTLHFETLLNPDTKTYAPCSTSTHRSAREPYPGVSYFRLNAGCYLLLQALQSTRSHRVQKQLHNH